jgi:hypothetical protein
MLYIGSPLFFGMHSVPLSFFFTYSFPFNSTFVNATYTFVSRMVAKPLSELSLIDRDVTVQVQINKMWEYGGTTDDGPVLHLDMVLADV